MNNMSNDISSSLLHKKSDSDDNDDEYKDQNKNNLDVVIEMDNLIHNNDNNN